GHDHHKQVHELGTPFPLASAARDDERALHEGRHGRECPYKKQNAGHSASPSSNKSINKKPPGGGGNQAVSHHHRQGGVSGGLEVRVMVLTTGLHEACQ